MGFDTNIQDEGEHVVCEQEVARLEQRIRDLEVERNNWKRKAILKEETLRPTADLAEMRKSVIAKLEAERDRAVAMLEKRIAALEGELKQAEERLRRIAYITANPGLMSGTNEQKLRDIYAIATGKDGE